MPNTSQVSCTTRRPVALLVGLALACGGLAPAAAQSLALPQAVAAPQAPGYTQAELDRLLAPIALYPDPLLSQILMAATYPLDVAEAAAWSRRHAGLRGDDAVRSVQHLEWDPSVKSLVAFPNILERMGENPSWVRSLGLAFLDQEPLVLETVQQLRQLARAAGSLQSDTRQRVVDDAGWLRILPVQTAVLHVPYYDPWVVYGSWRWAAYPPVFWAPWPGYVVHRARPRMLVWGPAIRISIGFFFGEIDWPRRAVMIAPALPYYSLRVVGMPGYGQVSVQTLRPGRWEHAPARRSVPSGADPAIARAERAERERLDRDRRQLQREETVREQQREQREIAERAERERAERSARRERQDAERSERMDRERSERIDRERRVQAERIERLEREQRELAARAAVQASAPPAPAIVPVQVIAPRSRGPQYPRADPQFTNSAPAPGSASAEHPPTGNPSPARQMQLEQERAARERQANPPSPAQRMQSREPTPAHEPREPREPRRPPRQRD